MATSVDGVEVAALVLNPAMAGAPVGGLVVKRTTTGIAEDGVVVDGSLLGIQEELQDGAGEYDAITLLGVLVSAPVGGFVATGAMEGEYETVTGTAVDSTATEGEAVSIADGAQEEAKDGRSIGVLGGAHDGLKVGVTAGV